MAPTALPDVLPCPAIAGAAEQVELNNVSSSTRTAATPSQELGFVSETLEKEPKKTIMSIVISYLNWLDKEGERSLRLKSVLNDLDLQLRRHNYTHDGTPNKFLIYADSELEYTDSNDVCALVPYRAATKPEILGGLAEAVSGGGSIVIYYSGHCDRRGPGESKLTFQDGHWRYEEDGVPCAGPPYLIASDGQRIYAEEVYAALGEGSTIESNTTITLIFDTCHAATFFDNVIKFPYLYPAPVIEGSKASMPKAQRSQRQIIFLAATQFDEEAQTFKLPKKEEVGAVTLLMTEFFEADREAPRSAQALVEKLYGGCRGRQTPQIQSLFPISGNFELLP